MATLYESIYQTLVEDMQVEGRAEKQAHDFAVEFAEGVAKELVAPAGAFHLTPPDEEPSLSPKATARNVMKRSGHLVWRFGFVLHVQHPQNGIILGQWWGEFTICLKGDRFMLSWGKRDLPFDASADRQVVAKDFASELHAEALRTIKSGGKPGRMTIGFSISPDATILDETEAK